MEIEARHVRRKQLSQYLDKELLNRERKSMESATAAAQALAASMRKRVSPDPPQCQQNPSSKRARANDSVRKSTSNANRHAFTIRKSWITFFVFDFLQFDDSPSATDASGKSMDKGSGNENDDQIVDEAADTDMESEKVTPRSGSQSPLAPSADQVSEAAPDSPRLEKQQEHAISESTVVTAAATACSWRDCWIESTNNHTTNLTHTCIIDKPTNTHTLN